jgi:AcrR family transcriptional regulator
MPRKKPAARRVGRPLGFDKHEALIAAMRVFWEKGFEGASTNDLTTAMGIQPASLYKAFGNKEQLFQQALDCYLAGPVSFMRQALEEPTAYEVAEHVLHGSALFLSRRGHPRGCLTIQGAMVGGKEGASVRRNLASLRNRGQQALQKRFERAQRELDLPHGVNAPDLARFVTTIFQGMTVQAINGASRQELLRVAATALRCFPTEDA